MSTSRKLPIQIPNPGSRWSFSQNASRSSALTSSALRGSALWMKHPYDRRQRAKISAYVALMRRCVAASIGLICSGAHQFGVHRKTVRCPTIFACDACRPPRPHPTERQRPPPSSTPVTAVARRDAVAIAFALPWWSEPAPRGKGDSSWQTSPPERPCSISTVR